MSRSIVEYFHKELDREVGERCGYCKNEGTRFFNGMWGHRLTTEDYQDLIDRGWRRSGQYCYKPINSRCCCPMYTIRCQSLDFKPTKSQKKVLRKFRNFIENGDKSNSKGDKTSGDNLDDKFQHMDEADRADLAARQVNLQTLPDSLNPAATTTFCPGEQFKEPSMEVDEDATSEDTKTVKSDDLGDAKNRPKMMKGKQYRRERWKQKQLEKGLSAELQTNHGNEARSLEEWLSYKPDSTHKFEIRVVPADVRNEAFRESFEESYNVYSKYQMSVHGDPASKCNVDQYKRFLCNNPLIQDGIYGAFHRQYLIDGKIVAVGVIDILPSCVSSVYLYYDPEYSFLTLGTYTSLSEIKFVRTLNRKYPDLKHYYLGFYIHSCPKMRYKGEFSPSFLCCPESYTWQPIERCRTLLDSSPYSRLSPRLQDNDVNEFKSLLDVLVLHRREVMYWSEYLEMSTSGKDEETRKEEEDEVTTYGQLVGKVVVSRMMLYRPS